MIFPNKFARGRQCTITSKTLTDVSEYGFVTQVSKPNNGQKWAIEFTTGLLEEKDARELSAFLDSLNGRYEAFTMKCPLRYLGTDTDFMVFGALGNNDLNITGLTPNTTDALVAGDFISINGDSKVYKITQGTDADGSGNGFIKVFPKIQTSALAGVAATSATFTLRMVSDDNSLALSALKSHYPVLISAIEA